MRRPVLRALAVLAWAVALAPAAGTFGAAEPGAHLDASGWWNRSQALPVQGDPTGLGLTTVPTVPAPATVPEDGLQVANDASGASAISAVRYLLEGQAGGTLTLQLPDGQTLTGTEEVVACPVQGGFTPAQNGRWDAKPAYDEATCVVEGAPSDDGTSLSFDIPATFASALGDVSIAIVPAPGTATPFTVAFAKPADDAFVITTQVQTAPSSPSTPAYVPGSAVIGVGSTSPSFDAPSTPEVDAPAASGGGSGSPSAPVALAEPIAGKQSTTDKVVGLVLLVAIGAALWWLGSQPARAPRLLGSVGGAAAVETPITAVPARAARVRGIGRFARHRDAPPTAI